MAKIKAVLFDLDGTLADTVQDMGAALNILLRANKRPPLDITRIRPLISSGTTALLGAGFNKKLSGPCLLELRTQYLDIYEGMLCKQTRLFNGVDAMLSELAARNMPWGIVTNKPAHFTMPLTQSLGLATHAGCIISGDTTAHSKPHPWPLQHACELLGCTPAETVYLGDSETDVQAARRAGIIALVALYGYLGENAEPQTWPADGYLQTSLELLAWLDANNGA